MAKQKYEVTRAWAGVSLGDVIDLDPENVHPAIKSNVRPVGAKVKGSADVEAAKAEAAGILANARKEAEKILTDAYAEAEKLKVKK